MKDLAVIRSLQARIRETLQTLTLRVDESHLVGKLSRCLRFIDLLPLRIE